MLCQYTSKEEENNNNIQGSQFKCEEGKDLPSKSPCKHSLRSAESDAAQSQLGASKHQINFLRAAHDAKSSAEMAASRHHRFVSALNPLQR